MDLETAPPPSTSLVKCCDCECSCSLNDSYYSGTWLRTVKRKFDEFEGGGYKLVIPGYNDQRVARVEVGNECAALREMVSNQQQTIQDLSVELEEERNASSSAANEAMSMILRLQREKAEIQMEARQFKRFTEEKMAHDQEELCVLDDLLYKREQIIQCLSCEVQAYKHRMMSYGLTESEAERERGGMSRNNSMIEYTDSQFELPPYDYPPLKCNLNENHVSSGIENDVADVEKYAFGETPHSVASLKDLEYRINQLENGSRHIHPHGDLPSRNDVLEKVVVGQSPSRPGHLRRFSNDSLNSLSAAGEEMAPDFTTDSPRLGSSFPKTEYVQTDEYSTLKKVDAASEMGDDLSDRIYTIDSVHQGVPYNGATEPNASVGVCDYKSTPMEALNPADVGDPEIKKLYMRLQVLEADRESMRQALISMRTDKAQLVLLKEIAQQLCKEMSPARITPVKKSSVMGSFSFTSIFKWVVSFVFWRRNARQTRYMCGRSANNVGLLMLLDNGPRVSQRRRVTSTQV